MPVGTSNKVVQQFNQQTVSVLTTPTPLSSNPALTNTYIDSFVLSVYRTAANSVFFGDSNVTTTSGIELSPGSNTFFGITNDPVYYNNGTDYPFTYWDLSQVFLIAAVATSVILLPFKRSYV